MEISYAPFWETLRRKSISQYRLINQYKFSAGQLGRMRKNMYVSLHTIEVLCSILGCSISEIVDIK